MQSSGMRHLVYKTSTRRHMRARAVFRVSKANYWRQIMVNGWTLERRERQAELIRQWQPWKQSTGPKTPEGKATASRNAWQGGDMARMRELAKDVNRVLREQRQWLKA